MRKRGKDEKSEIEREEPDWEIPAGRPAWLAAVDDVGGEKPKRRSCPRWRTASYAWSLNSFAGELRRERLDFLGLWYTSRKRERETERKIESSETERGDTYKYKASPTDSPVEFTVEAERNFVQDDRERERGKERETER